MATSGALNTSSYEGRYYRVEWSVSQSIANNTSTISWVLKSVGGNVSWYMERTLEVVIAGNIVVSKTYEVQRYSGVIASGSVVVPHDTNGNASFGVSIRAAVYYSSVNCTGSNTFTLDTIPRSATIYSAPNFTNADNPTITYSNPAGNAVTSLQACISFTGSKDDISYRDIPKTGTSYTFNLTEAEKNTLISSIPNATSRSVTFFVRTEIGGNTFYSTLQKTFTITENIVPSVAFEVAEAEGYMSRFGSYVQGKTKLQLNIQTSGSYGSTIKSCITSFDGKTYTGTSITTDAIVNSGELDLIVTVTDSRGRTASTGEKVRVMAYNPPQITSLTIKRTDANGVSSSNGAYLTAIFDAKVTKLDENLSVGYRQNEAVIKAKYVNKVDSSDANEATILLDAFDVQGGTYTFPANPSSSYEFALIVDDFFTQQSNTPTTKTVVGGTARKTFSVFRRGLGFAFGKIAELEDFLEVNFKTLFHKFVVFKNMVSLMMENSNGEYRDVMHMTATDNLKIGYDSYDKSEGTTDICGNDVNLIFRKGMWINGVQQKDFIVEEGEIDGWFYRKWNSGTAECWRNKTFTIRATLQWGYGYISCTDDGRQSAFIEQVLPSNLFTFVDDAQTTIYIPGHLVVAMGCWFDSTSVQCYAWLPAGPFDSLKVWNSCRAIGRWK